MCKSPPGVAVLVLVCACILLAAAAPANVDGTVNLFLGPGSAVSAVVSPAPAPCTLFQSPPPSTGLVFASDRVCIFASQQGLTIDVPSFKVQPLSFAMPGSVGCVRIAAAPFDGTNTAIAMDSEDAKHNGTRIECDVPRSFILAVSAELRATPGPGSSDPIPVLITWKQLQIHATTTWNVYVDNGKVATIETTTAEESVTAYADIPYTSLHSPSPGPTAPTPKPFTPASRAHSSGVDLAWDADQYNLLAASFAQNSIIATQQQTLAQISKNAALAIPTQQPNVTAQLPLTTQTRMQQILGFASSSSALADTEFKQLTDAAPFSTTKLQTLASGAGYAYQSPFVNAAALYALTAPGTYAKAYTATVVIPSPSPTPTPPTIKVRYVTATFASPIPPKNTYLASFVGPVNDSNYAPSSVQIERADVMNKNVLDRTDGIAFNFNAYDADCTGAASYCSTTLHVFGSALQDLNPTTGGMAALPLPGTTESTVFGAGGAYTLVRDSFVQLTGTLADQQSDPFFAPSAGTTPAFAPLSGPFAHLTFSDSGPTAHAATLDLLGFRLTNVYGDLDTHEGGAITLPFGGHASQWKFSTGVGFETISERMALLEQGYAQSYYTSAFSGLAPAGATPPPAVILHQMIRDYSLSTKSFPTSKYFSIYGTAGYETGNAAACAPETSPTATPCTPGPIHHIVYGLFGQSQQVQFAIASGTTNSQPAPVSLTTINHSTPTLNTPGALTAYLTVSMCPIVSAAITNAAYSMTSPIPQQGSTASAQIDAPFSIRQRVLLDLSAGYFNIRSATQPSTDQAGFLFALHPGFVAPPGQPAICKL